MIIPLDRAARHGAIMPSPTIVLAAADRWFSYGTQDL
jgi:hypothetical protein